MSRSTKTVGIFVAGVLLLACAGSFLYTEARFRRATGVMQLGQTQATVRSALGNPAARGVWEREGYKGTHDEYRFAYVWDFWSLFTVVRRRARILYDGDGKIVEIAVASKYGECPVVGPGMSAIMRPGDSTPPEEGIHFDLPE